MPLSLSGPGKPEAGAAGAPPSRVRNLRKVLLQGGTEAHLTVLIAVPLPAHRDHSSGRSAGFLCKARLPLWDSYVVLEQQRLLFSARFLFLTLAVFWVFGFFQVNFLKIYKISRPYQCPVLPSFLSLVLLLTNPQV